MGPKSFNDLKKATSGGFFQPEHLGRDNVWIGRAHASTPGHYPISSKALQHHLDSGSYSLFTAHNPMAQSLTPHENAQRNAKLEDDLKAKGAVYHKVKGLYGGNTEDSFMVHHTSNVQPHHLEDLARNYGQESIVHSSNRKNRMVYLHGDKSGQHHAGEGYTRDAKAQDFYSHPENKPKDKFTLNFNFDHLEKTMANSVKRLNGFHIQDDAGGEHHISLHFSPTKI